MKNSGIEWTDHTFNPWWGCQRVSEGCRNCYAETLAHRYGLQLWGPTKTTVRKPMSAAYWRQPLRWNAAAAAAGRRERVFCASMADVFEDHPDVSPHRERMWALIEQTPSLDWLLLTKRPEHMRQMLPSAWLRAPRDNVWLGTSAEDQATANTRIRHLMETPAALRFLSLEPLLGPIDLAESDGVFTRMDGSHGGRVDWVIVGGESGVLARPMHPDWARSLRNQCNNAEISFFFKQWGAWLPLSSADEASQYPRAELREGDDVRWVRVGKKTAGHLLDGVEHNAIPESPTLEVQ